MATKAQQEADKWVLDQLVTYVKRKARGGDERGALIDSIVGLAIQQQIDPGTLKEQGKGTTTDLFDSFETIDAMDVEEMTAIDGEESDENTDSPTGKRWRSIRAKALRLT